MNFKKYTLVAGFILCMGQQALAEGSWQDTFTSWANTAWTWTKNTSDNIMANPYAKTAINGFAAGTMAKGACNFLGRARRTKRVGFLANLTGFFGLTALSTTLGRDAYQTGAVLWAKHNLNPNQGENQQQS